MTVHVSPSVVRSATPEDREDIWRLFLMIHRENGLFKLSPEKVEFFFNRALYASRIPLGDTGPRGTIAVIGPPGKLEAICFVLIGSFWYSNEQYIEELLLFVDPEYRKSNHAKAMIDWLKNTAETTGMPVLTGILSNHRTEAKVRLYRRYLPEIGSFFLYPNKTLNGSGLVAASS